MFKKHKKLFITFIILIALILIGIFFLVYPVNKLKDLHNLSNSSYDSVFISMYSVENYSSEAFFKFRGLNTYIGEHPARTVSELSLYVKTALQSDNAVNTVYIGLDPYILYQKGCTGEVEMAAAMSDIFDFIIQYPDVTFEILLPSPSMDYWLSLDESELDEVMISYRYAVSCFEPHQNAMCFFVGDEEWLIMNPANYESDFITNTLISQKILCLTFCDRIGLINNSCAEEILAHFKEMILTEKESPSNIYPDLSDKTVVFFGDSILGLQNGSYSVPGVINGLTGASVYNYAIGGTTACDADATTDSDNSFTDQLGKFLSQADFYTRDDTQFPYSAVDSSNLVFVINYGYNDYKCCHSPQGLYETLISEITKIKTAYPESQIILMCPYENIYYYNGVASVNKNDETLVDYANAVKSVAGDIDITLLDVPGFIEGTENSTEYFVDECHYNEYGRFYLAQYIISAIK